MLLSVGLTQPSPTEVLTLTSLDKRLITLVSMDTTIWSCYNQTICGLDVGGTYIPIVKAHKLTAAVAFHHKMSQKIKRVFDPQTMTTLEFNDYLTMIYNPTKNIVPWTSPVKEDNPLLEQWHKNVKPSLQDYKEFCEEKCYQLWMQKTVNTIEAYGLEHLIDPSHTPADKKYDEAQRNWLFKGFKNTFLAGFARSLVKKYQNTKDT